MTRHAATLGRQPVGGQQWQWVPAAAAESHYTPQGEGAVNRRVGGEGRQERESEQASGEWGARGAGVRRGGGGREGASAGRVKLKGSGMCVCMLCVLCVCPR